MKNLPNLNGFPTDNSPSTQLKYDIIASKFMTGIENHKRRNGPIPSPISGLGLIGVIIEGTIALIVILYMGLRWLLKKS